jgi:hypothetical protein
LLLLYMNLVIGFFQFIEWFLSEVDWTVFQLNSWPEPEADLQEGVRDMRPPP